MQFDLRLRKKLKQRLESQNSGKRVASSRRTSPSCIKPTNGGLACGISNCWCPSGSAIKDIDAGVMQVIERHWDELIAAWDAKYPENPVSSVDEDEYGHENA